MPLTQAAFGAALASGAKMPDDALPLLFGERLAASAIWGEAFQEAQEILAEVAPMREGAARSCAALVDERVDRMILGGWCKEVRHLQAVFVCLFEAGHGPATIEIPERTQDVAAKLVKAALARANLTHRGICGASRRAIEAAGPSNGSRFAGPDLRPGPVGVVVSFGLADPVASTARLRTIFSGPILLVAEPNHAQADRLVSLSGELRARHGAVSVLALGNSPTLRPSQRQAVSPLADLLVQTIWPDRCEWTREIEGVLEGARVAWLLGSDHLSSSGCWLAQRTRRDGGAFWAEAHSAWSLRSEFETPILHDASRVSVWTRMAADHYRAKPSFAPESVIEVRSPERFRPLRRRPRQWFRRRVREVRSLLRPGPLSIGVLLTSGQGQFAPDGPVIDLADALRRLIEPGIEAGWTFEFRLREQEDDAAVWAKLLAAPEADQRNLRFHRVLGRGMADFLSGCDVAVEAGNETSAVLSATAMGVPALRLDVPGWTGTRPSRGAHAIPVMSAETPFEDLLRLAGTAGRRIRLYRNQRATL